MLDLASGAGARLRSLGFPRLCLRQRSGALNAHSRYAPIGALLLALLAFAAPAMAVNPDEMLKDPVKESRARDLGRDLRCLVCQNQSIDDSDADLAKDLRIIVRERITAGDSDEQVKTFLVDRYGDYVLLKPPFKLSTLVLWLGPFALFAVGIAVIFGFYGRRRIVVNPTAAPLSNDEKRRFEQLLREQSAKEPPAKELGR
jgi:cytochrome c-type biogenesis protein CcmH